MSKYVTKTINASGQWTGWISTNQSGGLALSIRGDFSSTIVTVQAQNPDGSEEDLDTFQEPIRIGIEDASDNFSVYPRYRAGVKSGDYSDGPIDVGLYQ